MPERGLPFQFNGCTDILVFALRPWIHGITTTPQSPQYNLCLLDPSRLDQPPRTLRHEENYDHEHEHWHDLERERKPPTEAPGPVANEADAVFEPVSSDKANIIECELKRDEEAANVFMRGFGGPDGEDTIEDPSAHTSDDAGAENPWGIHSASLQDISSWSRDGLCCQEGEQSLPVGQHRR